MRTRRFLAGGWAIALTVMVVPASALVFLRTGAGRGAWEEAPGTARVWQSEVTVNGIPGTWSLWRFSGSPATAADRLAAAWRAQGYEVLDGMGMHAGWLLARRDERLRRALVLTLGFESLVLLAEQEHSAPRAAARPSEDDMPADMPRYPGSVPAAVWIRAQDGAEIALRRTPDAPDSVRGYYDRRLREDGWTALSPAPAAGVAFYQRGRRLLVLGVHSAGQGADSMITWTQRALDQGAAGRNWE